MKWLNRDYKTFTKFKEEKELEVLVAEDTGYNEFLEYKDKYGNNSTIHFKKYKKYEKIKAFIDNNSFLCLFVIPMFSVSIVVIAIVAFFTQKNTDNLVKVLTYFLALITLMATIINYSTQKKLQQEISNKKLIAEIIAKSRIEWLKEMRELVSEYMSLSNQASFYLESNWYSLTLKRPKKEKLTIYNELVKRADTYYYKIMFNLNNKEAISTTIDDYSKIFKRSFLCIHFENTSKRLNKISREKKLLVKVAPSCKNSQVKIDWIIKRIDTINLEIEELALINTMPAYRKSKQVKVGAEVQAYFKREWDKAKEEIRSGEVATPDKQEKQF